MKLELGTSKIHPITHRPLFPPLKVADRLLLLPLLTFLFFPYKNEHDYKKNVPLQQNNPHTLNLKELLNCRCFGATSAPPWNCLKSTDE